MGFLKQRYEEILELSTKIVYFCLAVSTFSSFIYISAVQPVLVKLALVFGAALIAMRLVKYRKYAKMPGVILMVLFCLSFAFSSVMNRQYGIADNGKWLIWTGIQFFALYLCDVKRDKGKYQKEFRILSHLIIGYSAVASAVSMWMLVTSYSALLQTADGELVVAGFTWGRLWGVYTDPNYGGIFSVIAVILALMFFLQKKGKQRILYVIGILLNFLYLIFSDSRTGELALICSGGLFVFLWLVRKFDFSKRILRYGAPALIVLCLAAGLFGGIQVIKTEYNQKLAPIFAEMFPQKVKKAQKPDQVKKEVGRKKDLENDVSNGRLALWGSAVEVWETSPVYGTGYATFVQYTQDHVPDTYAVNAGETAYTSLHNEFFNVLVYQGAIGFVLFMLIGGRILIYVLKPISKAGKEDYLNLAAMLASVSAVGISMVFLLEGLYTNSPGAFVLWVFAGYMVQYSYRIRNEEKQ